jgi:hypothetical protein
MYGAASGLVNGVVISTNASGAFSGINFTNLTSANYTRAGGDSGAVVYTDYSATSTRNTCGAHKGGNDTTSYFCKASLINTALSTSRY